MDTWRNNMGNWETEEIKKSSDTTRKVVLVMIVLVIIAIIAMGALLMYIQTTTFKLYVGTTAKTVPEGLIKVEDGTTYFNIKQMADLLSVEYHIGEFKGYESDYNDKCYIKSSTDTASFYLNSNKICKLEVDKSMEDYDVLTSEKNTILIGDDFYAPIDAIEKGFNVAIRESQHSMTITTLDQILTSLNKSLNKATDTEGKETTYLDFTQEPTFSNKKAALYGYIVAYKNSSGLYGVINTQGEEVLPDKYKNIQFLESTQEFFVTNSSDKMGIIDAYGKNKIPQNYDTIKLINRDPKLYMVSVSDKYGVLDENGGTIIYTEYDAIGIDTSIYKKETNQYVLLENAIPVCQNEKYGAFDIQGKKIIDVKYDGIGYEQDRLPGTEKVVNPTASIPGCNGIVVKSGETYGVRDASTGKELLPTKVTAVYYITDGGVDTYYYVFKGRELDLIQDLIKNHIIENPDKLKQQANPSATGSTPVTNTTNTAVVNNVMPSNTTTATPTPNATPTTSGGMMTTTQVAPKLK